MRLYSYCTPYLPVSSRLPVSTTASGSPPTKFGQDKHEAVATGDQFSTRTTPSPPLRASDEEAQLYYAGLVPSKPVAHTPLRTRRPPARRRTRSSRSSG